MIKRAVTLVATVGILSLTAAVAHAVFADSQVVGSNTFSTGTLAPPTLPLATPGCTAGTRKIDVSWTASTSTFADGYDVRRSLVSGGPYSTLAHVNGRLTTAYTDLAVVGGTTYHYVIVATSGAWTSVQTGQVTAVAPPVCV